MNDCVEILASGFSKVASVIDANPNYGYILGERIKKKEYEEVSNKAGLIEKKKALYFLEKALEKRMVAAKKIPDDMSSEVVFCYGSTHNNKREFEFFKKAAKQEGYFFEFLNLNDCENFKIKASISELCVQVKKAYDVFLKDRKVISKSILHQTVSYALSSVSIYESLRKKEINRFVVANDHSPVPVAYAKIAKIMGAKVLYLQHAEVTESFPALDFDYSILRNKISKDIYLRKGFSGGVTYLDRGSEQIGIDNLRLLLENSVQSENVTVVIYPSSVFNLEECKFLIRKLGENQYVSSVFVKFHPAFKDVRCLENEKLKVIDTVPNENHIAICGNSSVAIELIAKGNLVFNYFSLDDISKDYYRFVEKGLTRELSASSLQECFWKNVDVSLVLLSLSDYIPSVSSVFNEVEPYNARESLVDFINSEDIEKKKQIWFERDVFLFGYELLKCLRRGDEIPYEEMWVINNLNRLFNERNPGLNGLYKFACFKECNSVFEFWLNTKVMEWNGKVPSSEELSVLINFLSKKNFERKLLGWMELKCFDVVLRFGSKEKLVYFLSLVKILDVYKVGINKKISYLNYIKNNDSNDFELKCFYDLEKDNSLSSLDLLKVFVQSGVESLKLVPCKDFVEVEEKFIKAHKKISHEYIELVKKPYSLLGGRACFIDVKRNDSEEKKLLELVGSKILNCEGFSFIRLSDGEGIIFKEYGDFFTEEDSLNRQRHWWGEEISSDVLEELCLDLIKAVKDADLLGIPSVYRFVRDHSDKTNSLLQNLQGRGLISVLNGIRYIDTENKLYTDDKANIAVFNKIEVIEDLAMKAKKVIVINSGSSDAVKEAFGGRFDYEHVQVPTHHKTSLNDKYHSDSRALPYVYKDIVSEIKLKTEPGALVLVGAGVAGKVFMQAAKEKGGVALDLGSAMDQFLNGGIQSLF